MDINNTIDDEAYKFALNNMDDGIGLNKTDIETFKKGALCHKQIIQQQLLTLKNELAKWLYYRIEYYIDNNNIDKEGLSSDLKYKMERLSQSLLNIDL